MKRVVDVLYGLQGFPNAVRFGEFKTDLFANGTTPAIDVDDDVTTGLTISGATTTGILISGATTTGISITGVCGGSCIDFDGGTITTGSLIDYSSIDGKVSGYLFNGSMANSVLTSTFIADDFSMACDHDGDGDDTLRLIRRIWSGDIPNDGSIGVTMVIAEYNFTGTIGDSAGNGGSVTGVGINLGDATVNDSAAIVYGLYVDATPTNEESAAIHGVYVVTSEYGLSIDGGTSAINIVDASDLTNLFKFNEFAGCLNYADVDPADIPSGGGLGADGCIQIDIGGSDYFIPVFMTTLS